MGTGSDPVGAYQKIRQALLLTLSGVGVWRRGVKQCKPLSQKWFPACHVQHAIVSHFAIIVVLDPFILYTFHNMKLGQF